MKDHKRVIIWVALGLSVLGFADSTYLAISRYLDGPPLCFIVTGCDAVLGSAYASIAGIPVAHLGVFYYLSLFFLFAAYLDLQKENILLFASRFALLGFLATMWFLYLQSFVIRAWCIYCLVSAFSSISVFLVSRKIVQLMKHKKT